MASIGSLLLNISNGRNKKLVVMLLLVMKVNIILTNDAESMSKSRDETFSNKDYTLNPVIAKNISTFNDENVSSYVDHTFNNEDNYLTSSIYLQDRLAYVTPTQMTKPAPTSTTQMSKPAPTNTTQMTKPSPTSTTQMTKPAPTNTTQQMTKPAPTNTTQMTKPAPTSTTQMSKPSPTNTTQMSKPSPTNTIQIPIHSALNVSALSSLISNQQFSLTPSFTTHFDIRTIDSNQMNNISDFIYVTEDNSSKGQSSLTNYVTQNYSNNGNFLLTNYTTENTSQNEHNLLTDYITEDNSLNGRSLLTDYSSLNYPFIENTLKASAVSSEWEATLSRNQSTIRQYISTTTLEVSSYHLHFDVTSKAITDSSLNASFCCQPTVLSKTSTEDKDWAVPVVICLSTLLIVSWIILIVVCCRWQKSAASRRHLDIEEQHSHQTNARNQDLMFESVIPFSFPQKTPRQEHNTIQKFSDQQLYHHCEDVKHINSDADLRISNANLSCTSNTCKDSEAFEMEKISPKDEEYKYSNERQRNEPVNNHELEIEWDSLRYNDHRFVPSSSETDYSYLDVSHGPFYLDQRKSESFQDSKWHSTDSNREKQDFVSSEKIQKRESNGKTSIDGVGYSTQNKKSSDSRFHDDYNKDIKENIVIELTHINSGLSEKENHGECNNKNSNTYDRRNIRGDSKGLMHIGTSDEEDGNMITSDIDSTCASYDVETVRLSMGENRPGIPKCVSFDDSHYQGTRERFGIINKVKGPTRKISTISDTAMTYLSLPEQGFMAMASCYETVDNLTEIGDTPIGSRFFIGSGSDNSNSLCQTMAEEPEQLNPHASENNNQLREYEDKNNSEVKNVDNFSTNMDSKHDNSGRHCSMPKDDYIFPIVRKANMKIMAERQHRKLTGKGSSVNQDEDTSLANGEISSKTEERKFHVGFRIGEDDLSKCKPSVSAHKNTTAATTLPSRRVSYPIQIPKIILTKDNEVMVGSDDVNEVQTSTTDGFTRVRRIARANNPFLIEAPSQVTSKSEEKVRRSSAPSMPRKIETTLENKDRMIRSASGDHLCLNSRQEHFPRYGLQTARSWSSEFFDLIQNSKRETRSDDERVKKMIDDRYNALFSNKYPQQVTAGRSQKQSYMQDLSPKIRKLISDYSNNPLSQNTMANALNIEARSRFEPILEARLSEIPFESYSNASTDPYKGKHFRRVDSGSRKDYFSNSVPSIDAALNKKSETPLPSDFSDSPKSIFTTLLNDKSSRPDLAQGTDGQDSETEIQQEESLRNSSGSDDSFENKPRPIKENDRYGGVDTAKKISIAAIHWESFEDSTPSRSFSRSTPFPEKKMVKDTYPFHLASKRVEQTPEHKVKDDPVLLTNEISDGCQQQRHLSLPINEVNTEEHDVNVADRKQKVVAKLSFQSPGATPGVLENRFSSPSYPQTPVFPVLPNLSQEKFDNNFDVSSNNTQNANTEENLKNKPDQGLSQNKSLTFNKSLQTKVAQTSQEKPSRIQMRKALRNGRLKRASSPYLFEGKENIKATNNQTENSPIETISHSPSLQNKNRNKSKLFPQISSPGFKPELTSFPKSRSRSLDVPSSADNTRLRAITLENENPWSHFVGFNDWSKLSNDPNSTFVTSANNTQLEHNSEVNDLNSSVSEPELELYFGSTPSPIHAVRRYSDQNRSKLLTYEDESDEEKQVSFI